jgi:hypothetical protein
VVGGGRGDVKAARDGIHENAIPLRVLGIILRFLRPEVSTFFLSMLLINKLSFSSLIIYLM